MFIPHVFVLCTTAKSSFLGKIEDIIIVMNETPIGLLIKEELQRQERTVAWFARKLSCDRSNVYRLFNKHSIETDLLIRISAILNRDFTSEISSIIQARLQSQNQQHF